MYSWKKNCPRDHKDIWLDCVVAHLSPVLCPERRQLESSFTLQSYVKLYSICTSHQTILETCKLTLVWNLGQGFDAPKCSKRKKTFQITHSFPANKYEMQSEKSPIHVEVLFDPVVRGSDTCTCRLNGDLWFRSSDWPKLN